MNTPHPPRLVPLGNEAHAWAQQFAAEQPLPEKSRKVYLNTLAVYAVYTYLRWLQIEANLSLGDSWNFGTRTLLDVADLVLPDVGKLECRPVLPGETKISIPPEVSENRIGYVAVLLSEPFNRAQLLGFINSSELDESDKIREEIQLDAFQPISNLLAAIPEEVVEETASSTSSVPVNLSLWLLNIFDESWRSVEELFRANNNELSFGVRNTPVAQDNSESSVVIGIRRGKLINLELQMNSYLLVLEVTITPELEEQEGQMDILVKVRPATTMFLPQNLQMSFLDENNEIIWEEKTRASVPYLRQRLTGKIGDDFSVKLALENATITEYFVI